MTHAYVVDTNVAIVANARNTAARPECIMACVDALKNLVSSGMLVMDDGDAIFSEYRRHLHPAGQPGVGDMFMRWVFEHLYNDTRCERVAITVGNTGYAEFPADKDLTKFDRSDRKFVAVAITSRFHPPILNAVDSDYTPFMTALSRHGVTVSQLCCQPPRKKQRRPRR